jgi:hypothetical protein
MSRFIISPTENVRSQHNDAIVGFVFRYRTTTYKKAINVIISIQIRKYNRFEYFSILRRRRHHHPRVLYSFVPLSIWPPFPTF